MMISDKMRMYSNRNVETVNTGKKDELSVLPKRLPWRI